MCYFLLSAVTNVYGMDRINLTCSSLKISNVVRTLYIGQDFDYYSQLANYCIPYRQTPYNILCGKCT